MVKVLKDRAQAAQDAFAQLVEECRIGTLYRCELLCNPNRTKFILHKPGIDLSDLPVFYLGEMADSTDAKQTDAALDAVQAKQFRLPYPRCGFLSYLPASSLALTRGPDRYRLLIGRYYLMLAQELDDGVLFSSFMLHDNKDHWAKQVWQVFLNAKSIEYAYDPAAIATTDADFLDHFQIGTEHRVTHLLPQIHRLMTRRQGTVAAGVGTAITARINARRQNLQLGAVPAIRIIDLDAPEPAPAASASHGKGAPKAPHYRRSTWRTLPTGRKVFVSSAAIHGGTGSPPPWYEVVH